MLRGTANAASNLRKSGLKLTKVGRSGFAHPQLSKKQTVRSQIRPHIGSVN